MKHNLLGHHLLLPCTGQFSLGQVDQRTAPAPGSAQSSHILNAILHSSWDKALSLTKPTMTKSLSNSGYQAGPPFSPSKFQKQKNHDRIFNRESFSISIHSSIYDLRAPTLTYFWLRWPPVYNSSEKLLLITVLNNNPYHLHPILVSLPGTFLYL